MTATDPVLHGTFYDQGSCSYSGPEDDRYCGIAPVLHAAYWVPEHAWFQTLTACPYHAARAIRAARLPGTEVRWHPFGDACPAPKEEGWPCGDVNYLDDGTEVPE